LRIALFVLAVLALAAPAAAQAPASSDPPARTGQPTKGLLFGSKMTIEKEACCTPGGRGADPREATVFAAARDSRGKDRASRDDQVLRLRLQDGRTLKITDCDDQAACEADRYRRHRLAAWWPAQGLYVVSVGLYEDGLAYLVSEKDGRTTQVANVPVLSPSGHRAVALSSNLMNGVSLDLIDLGVQPPRVTALEKMPTCPGFGPNSFLRPRPVWVDDGHVRFDGTSPQPGDDPNSKQLLRFGAGKTEWVC
jgi:hypothetical protein